MDLYLRGLLTGVFFGLWIGATLVLSPDRAWYNTAMSLAAAALVGVWQYKWVQRNVMPKPEAAA